VKIQIYFCRKGNAWESEIISLVLVKHTSYRVAAAAAAVTVVVVVVVVVVVFEISGSHGCVCMRFKVFWDVAPCSRVEVDRCFRGAYCLRHQGDDGGSTHL
jgi:hypothetical protein